MSLTLDHVILAVGDLGSASSSLGSALGVDVGPGGEHPGWGTHNAIVRFGSSYLELIAVHDVALARQRPRGARLLSLLEQGPGWLGYALRSDDLDASVRELRGRGLPIGEPEPGRRMRPDGVELRWRTAGFDDAMWGGLLPFLIQHEIPPSAATSNVLAIEVGARDLARAKDTYVKLIGEHLRLADGCQVRLAPSALDGLQCVELLSDQARSLSVLGARFVQSRGSPGG